MPELRNRPAQPDVPSEPYPHDMPASHTDLRQRLDRLPPGHPSSPRNADLGSSDQALERSRAPRRDRDAPIHEEPIHDEADRGPDAIRQGYWSDVPRFLAAWAEHMRNWPADRAATAVDRSRDPAGSWRGDGNQYLNPEQHSQAKDVIAGVQRAEKTLTGHMEEAERDNTCGGRLAGKEFRLKGEERLKEKIAEKIESEPSRTPAEAVRHVSDTIRYTFCFEPENYTNGYWAVKQRLEEREYRMVYSKNHWPDDPEYKGVNSRWVTQEGQRFEVQFHTAESFHAKQRVTHGSYERDRNRLTGRPERREIEAFHRDVCDSITVPDMVETIPDHKE